MPTGSPPDELGEQELDLEKAFHEALVAANTGLLEKMRASGIACTKPWTTVEEREDDRTRVPEDVTTCCWLRSHHGKAQTGEELLDLWNSPSLMTLRLEMAQRKVPSACPSGCPLLVDRDGWFEKQEFFDYSKEELRSYSDTFLDNRKRIIELTLAGRADVDAYPIRLKIFPSNKCNLRCNMCMVDFETPYTRTWYDGPVFEKMLPYLEELLVFGAEPFLCDTSRRLLLSPSRYPQTHFSFITNGTLVTEKIIEQLAEKRLGAVDVSLDSCVKDTYEAIRLRGKFENAARGARLLADLGREHPIRKFPVYANFVIQELNYRELPQFITFCAETGLQANPTSMGVFEAPKKRLLLYGYPVAEPPTSSTDLLRSFESASRVAEDLGQTHALHCIDKLSRWLRHAQARTRGGLL